MTSIAMAPRAERIRPGLLAVGLLLGGTLFGLLAGSLMAAGKGTAVVGLAVVLVPVLLWRRPYLAPATVLAAALAIEQFPNGLGVGAEKLTSSVPLFHGLGSVHLSAADLLLGAVLLLAIAKRGDRVGAGAGRTPVGVALGALSVVVLVAMAVGLTHGGQMRVSLMETRPYAYLVCTYVIATTLLSRREAIRAVMWVIVCVAGFKAVQGLLIFVAVRHVVPRPEAVLGHEEALFFGVFLFLVASLWLFGVHGRMRTVATWIAPLVVMADLANSRRAAWLVLGGGMVALAILGAKTLPGRRDMIIKVCAVVGVLLAVYMPAFWNKTGGLAQPARAIRSIVAPSTRDASSDLYRIQEDANLQVNIREGGMLGRGFGVAIDYPLEIADISDIDPLIAYVPHNGVLYVLMRMGLAGGIALFALIGIGLIGACRLARSRDREMAVLGAVLACSLIGYAMEGAVDQGFFFYRIAFVLGTLLGTVEVAHRLRRQEAAR